MISFKDMTFCTFYETCKYGEYCFRRLSPEVRQEATLWWGADNGPAPIAQFIGKPGCYSNRMKKTKVKAEGRVEEII